MANPRVFVSSTCYDLSEVRDVLVEFIKSYGFDPVLSDRGDVFYHPDVHTHDSCVNEVDNCEIFILIIGGRFGGNYVADSEKSIVNAEYSAARKKKVPVFTFVKRSVFSDHFVYKKNRDETISDKIVFPSIENNSHAKKIFGFIDEVRLSSSNNGFFSFDLAREITTALRKQWAGMFFDFLKQRSMTDQFESSIDLLDGISVASEKVENLVKRLYRHIDKAGADQNILQVENLSVSKQFFEECERILERSQAAVVKSGVDPNEFEFWHDYLASLTEGDAVTNESTNLAAITWDGVGPVIQDPESEPSQRKYLDQQHRFGSVKKLESTDLESLVTDLRLAIRHDK